MPDFVSTLGTPVSPWGVNEFLRSTKTFLTESYMCSAAAVPSFTRDNAPLQKELKAGVVMAKITSGPEAGKIGPFQVAGSAEVQTLTPSGTWTGAAGTFRVQATGSGVFADVVAQATAAQLQAALRSLPEYAPYLPTVSGGPFTSGLFTITFGSGTSDADVPQIQFSAANVTGGTSPNAVAATTTQGVGGSNDGRNVAANIVGLNLTTLPWQLTQRDVEVSVVYGCEAVQGWCFETTAAGLYVPLSNATAAFMQRGGAAGKSVDIGWH